MNRRKRTGRRIAAMRARLGDRDSVTFVERDRRIYLERVDEAPLGLRLFWGPRLSGKARRIFREHTLPSNRVVPGPVCFGTV